MLTQTTQRSGPFTFTFPPFSSVTHFAHALVQLRGVLTNSIWVAVVQPQGTLVHICEKTAGSGGMSAGGEQGMSPEHIPEEMTKLSISLWCPQEYCVVLCVRTETRRGSICPSICVIFYLHRDICMQFR